MKRKCLARVSSRLPRDDDGLLLVFVRRLVLLKRRFWRRLGFRGAFLRRLLGIVSVTPPVSHVEMWPYVRMAAARSESQSRTASRIESLSATRGEAVGADVAVGAGVNVGTGVGLLKSSS